MPITRLPLYCVCVCVVAFAGVVASGVIAGGVIVSGEVAPVAPITKPHPQVIASGETQPVPSADDAADDPALWVHPSNPSKSLILGTDKQHGLFTYSLDGAQRQALAVGRLNNVDVRQRVSGAKGTDVVVDIAAATNRTTKTVDLFLIDAQGVVSPALAIASGFTDPYGVCLYHSVATGKLYVFACDKPGLVRQWEVSISPDRKLAATEVRSFEVGSQSEGMVCDDQAGFLFIGEEQAGVWRYNAEPTAKDGEDTNKARTLICAALPIGPLVADVEGLAIARPAKGPAHLVVSSQGDNSYHLLDLAPPHAHRGSFVVSSLRASKASDGGAVQETDGIEIYAAPLPGYPGGIMIVQDGRNAPFPQNFKMLSWDAVLRSTALSAADASGKGSSVAGAPVINAKAAESKK